MKSYIQIAVLALCAAVVSAQTVSVTVDASGAGKTFRGVGALNGGAPERLLYDYADPYRSDILDYLFKPNYGAALQNYKLEIGNDGPSLFAEPSHERANGVADCDQPYIQWYFALQALARNPSLILDSLMWGSSGWVSTFYSAANHQFVADWLTCASGKGLTIPTTGVWNEVGDSSGQRTWIKDLRTYLNAHGFSSVGIIANDGTGGDRWDIGTPMISDSTLASAISAISAHYVNGSDSSQEFMDAAGRGKELWDSEEGFWDNSTLDSAWASAQYLAKRINHDYIDFGIVKTELWSLVSGYYAVADLNNAGLVRCNTPWSGNYTVQPPLWAVAHTTQFIQPGWKILDGASKAILGGTGSYRTGLHTNGSDWSMVIETKDESGTETFTITPTNGASTGTVHVWRSNSSTQFVQQADLTISSGHYTLVTSPDSIYSLTTTTGQAKGSASPASSLSFPFPYAETFSATSTNQSPKYFSDIGGAFQGATCATGRTGTCLRQIVTTAPIQWPGTGQPEPLSIVGDITWTDGIVKAYCLVEQTGSCKIFGRMGWWHQISTLVAGYQFYYSGTGAWNLKAGNTSLLSGTVASSLNTWHLIELKMSGTTISAKIDGSQVGSTTDSTYTTGLAGVGASDYINVQFDDFQVCTAANVCAATADVSQVTLSSETAARSSIGFSRQ